MAPCFLSPGRVGGRLVLSFECMPADDQEHEISCLRASWREPISHRAGQDSIQLLLGERE